MEVITVASRKGGTGKSSTALALGAGLRRKGYSVLFVDLDSQGNLSYSLQASADFPSSMDVLRRGSTAQAAIQHTPQGDVLAGAEDLAGADTAITGTGKEYRLREALAGLAYDYVIIDTPATLGTLTVNALTASSCLVVPVMADIYSLQGMAQLHSTVQAVQKYCNRDLYIRGIILTRYSGRAKLSRDMQENLEEVARLLDTFLYSTPIRDCIAVKEAQAQQQDIFTYAPRSNAAKDYAAFVDEFIQKGKNNG